MIKIDKEVPMPKAFRKKYPFREMKVGDSFEIKGEKPHKLQVNVMACAARYKPMIFSSRITGEDSIRLWRIA